MKATYYVVPKTESLTLAHGEKPLSYWKELIYEGDFVKETKNAKQEFSVHVQDLVDWAQQFELMLSNGVEVPVPKGHTTDPEARRGTVRKMRVDTNRNGKAALYGLIEFVNEEAAALARTTNVSIFADEFTDGKGTKYPYPIQHVALTDYPVIPNLDKFEALAASLVEEKKEPLEMALDVKKLAKLLEIDEATEEGKLQAAFESAIANLKKGPAKAPEKKPVAASLVNVLAKSRKAQIDALVTNGKCTPAVATKLQEQFCKADSLTLSLSTIDDSQDIAKVDGFDAILDAFSANESVISYKEKTGPQAPVVLSREDISDTKKNPMAAAVAKRVEAAK